jgi:hypothetical protein
MEKFKDLVNIEDDSSFKKLRFALSVLAAMLAFAFISALEIV